MVQDSAYLQNLAPAIAMSKIKPGTFYSHPFIPDQYSLINIAKPSACDGMTAASLQVKSVGYVWASVFDKQRNDVGCRLVR
jgi:hypothetical protein